MSRKGFITLTELVKMIPHLILFFILLFVLFQAYTIFYTGKPTQPMADLNRIVSEIDDLKQGESIIVPILGEEYAIEKRENDPTTDPKCAKQCLCTFEGAQRKDKTLCLAVETPIVPSRIEVTRQKSLLLSYDGQNRIKISENE